MTDINGLTKRLEAEGVSVSKGEYVDYALHLDNINYINRLPGFKEGEFFVQDESSMLVYEIADAKSIIKDKNDSQILILDMCAAPGGKSTHFAENLENAIVEARDVSEAKLELIRENIERLKLTNVKIKFLMLWFPMKT